MSVFRSLIRVVLTIEMSQLNCPGPRRMPTPELPNSVGRGLGPKGPGGAATEFGATGSGQVAAFAELANAFVFKKPPSRDTVLPEVATCPYENPGHICARALS